jgi:hypothetical protein
MVKSEKIYSPQQYLEAVTNKYYIAMGDDDIRFIEDRLKLNELELWNYPLSEIDHILENKLNVVIVDCMCWDTEAHEFKHRYRWFEVPEDFEEV